jgi:hypothetical protein
MFSHVVEGNLLISFKKRIIQRMEWSWWAESGEMWHTRSAMLWGSVACPLLARCRTCRGGAAPPPADEAAPPAGGVAPPLAAGPPRLCGDIDPPCDRRQHGYMKLKKQGSLHV